MLTADDHEGGRARVRHLVVTAPDDADARDLLSHLPTPLRLPAGGEAATGPAPDRGRPLRHGQSLTRPDDSDGWDARRPPVAWVVTAAGPDSGRAIGLRPGRWVTIGRDPGCDLTVEDPALSRVHLRVRQEADRFVVQDLGSTNGLELETGGEDDGEDEEAPSGAGTAYPRPRRAWLPGSSIHAGGTRLLLRTGSAAPLELSEESGRQRLRPWPRTEPQVDEVELTTPTRPEPRAVRMPSAWTWSLPLVIGVVVAVVLRMPWLMLFGLLGPAMIIGQHLGDRRSARLEHRDALAAHALALGQVREACATSLTAELSVRRDRDPGLLGVREALLPEPSVRLWSRAVEPPRVVLGEADQESCVSLDGVRQRVRRAPVTLVLDRPLAVVGHPVARDALLRSWVLQLATSHPPQSLEIVVDPERPPAGWDLLAWLPHTRHQKSSRRATRSLDWSRDLVLATDLSAVPTGMPRVLVAGTMAPAVLQRPGEPDLVFAPTLLSHPLARSLSRRLARLTDGSGPAGAAGPATLGDLLPWPTDPARALAGWDRPGVDLSVPLGTDPTGAPVTVDLATDGPHALVAGTTGSGKSELLRTLVTGLALRNRPDRLALLLIDYKGGSSLGECAALPHSTGLVTDLDPHLAGRVLVSLQAELRRREGVLAQAGARDVREYLGDDLPRLLVVVDEFRVLREELPAFLDGLIRVAAVGRSLGLHLVLATQRPAGVVTADLRANVNLRIALRLRDESDSRDVLDTPDAALLPEGRPGLGLLRTGSGAPRGLQVVPAAPGTVAGADWEVHEAPDVWSAFARLHRPREGVPVGSGLGRLPALLTQAAAASGMRSRTVWLPPLPAELVGGGPGLGPSVWAVADRPEAQLREPLGWDGSGHVGVLGSARSGRSTALAALARAAGPAWLYVLDPGRGLEQLGLEAHPGVRAWVSPDDGAHGLRVLELLVDLVDRRLAAGTSEDGPGADRVVVVLDGWDRFVDGIGAVDSGRGTELALRVLRDGPAAGVSCLVSGDRTLLLGKVAATLPQTWALRLNDPGELVLSGLRRDQLPVDPPPGRLVRLGDGLVAQVVRPPAEGPTWPAAPESPPGRTPPLLRPLPRDVDPARAWAVGGDDAADLPAPSGSFLVLGPPRSGVTSTLAGLAATPDGAVLHVDGPGSWEEGALREALGRHPETVVVDQAHLLAGSRLEDLVLGWAEQGSGRLLVGGELEACTGLFRGLVPFLARHRRGLVLQPSAPRDGQLLGVAVPVGDPRVPGRGVLVERGRTVRVQVSRPPAGP